MDILVIACTIPMGIDQTTEIKIVTTNAQPVRWVFQA
jgi:hypothetical protein